MEEPTMTAPATTTLIQPKAERRASLSAQLEEFDPTLTRLDALIGRTRGLVDRISGSRPRGAANPDKEEPSPASIVGMVRHRRDRLARLVDQLEREVSGVEESL